MQSPDFGQWDFLKTGGIICRVSPDRTGDSARAMRGASEQMAGRRKRRLKLWGPYEAAPQILISPESPLDTRHRFPTYLPRQPVQGVAGNKKSEFEVEAQFLSKLHTKNGYFLLKLLLKGTKNEAQFLKITVSYCPRPPVEDTCTPLPVLSALD
jgi:hypothetical protein